MKIQPRRRCRTALLFLVPLRLSIGQPALGPPEFRQDLDAVITQLPSRHLNLFFQTPKAEFDAAAQRLQADIPNLSSYQFYTRLAALVAMARNGHTSLNLTPAAGFTQLAITLRRFSDGYFVISAPQDRPNLNRAKLTHVGVTPVDQVLSALEPVISHENEYYFQARAAQGLANLGIMRGLGFLPASGPATYQFRLDSGQEVSFDLASSGPGQTRALESPAGFIPPLSASAQDYWSAYWPESKTLYIRVARFRASDGGRQLAADALALLDADPVDSFVFDLRNNSGGDLTVVFALLQGLTQRLNALQSNPRFQMFALVDGGSYSSASFLAAILKFGVPDFLAPLAPGIGNIPTVLAGEPTGGPTRTHGNPLTFALPASRMEVSYATVYSPPIPGVPDRDAIYPDIPAPEQSTDYFARHDPALAAVLARAAQPPAAPTGDAIAVNSASFRTGTGIAPGSFASAFGAFPAGSLTLTVNGEAARVVAATTSQIVFVVPPSAAAGTARLEVQQGGQIVSLGEFQITPAGPGLFVIAAEGAQPGAVLNQDGTLNTAAAPAERGSVLQIFGTGYGTLDASGQAAVAVWVANLPADVLFSGPTPGIPGLWQINARVPNDSSVTGQVPVFASAQNLVSNGVTVFVRP